MWRGFDVDYCRAVAIAIFGTDQNRVRYVPTTAQARFTALQSGEVDPLSRNKTWTPSRDTALGFDFAGVNFHDGQGFLVKRSLGVQNARQLDGATICVQPGTTTEQNLADLARGARVQIRPVVMERLEENIAASNAGRCDACTTDVSGLAATLAAPLAVWWALGAPFTPDIPALRGFNFRGGLDISPEFFALLLGPTLYTAAFIAEIVRAGIEAVHRGQWEAADALGLPRGRVLSLVVLPQAPRVIIPPMTSPFLNITKNSSLAVAIGYHDIVSIVNTTLNQTGQAIEGIAIIVAVYLTISLSITLFMNWYNAKIASAER